MKWKATFLLIFLIVSLCIFTDEVKAAIIFTDGFESGYTPWTGTLTGGAGTIAINQTIVHHGVNSSRSETSGGGADYALAYKTFTPQSDVFARAYVYYDAGTNTYNEFADFIQLKDQADGNPYVAIGIKVANGSDWNLHLRYYNGTLYDVDSNTKISENAWHSLELHVNCSNGNIDVFLNGVNITDLHIENVNFGANQIDQLQVGLPHFAGAGFWWPVTDFIDCVVVADAYIGVEAVGEVTEEIFETILLTNNMFYWRELGETINNIVNVNDNASDWKASYIYYTETGSVTVTVERSGEWLLVTSITVYETASATSTTLFWRERLFTEAETITVLDSFSALGETILTSIEYLETINITGVASQTFQRIIAAYTINDAISIGVIGLIIALCAVAIAVSKKD